jgi:hypothetical protein
VTSVVLRPRRRDRRDRRGVRAGRHRAGCSAATDRRVARPRTTRSTARRTTSTGGATSRRSGLPRGSPHFVEPPHPRGDTPEVRAQRRHRPGRRGPAPGRGSGTVISLDELSVISVPSRPDRTDQAIVDNDALGYVAVSGAWKTSTLEGSSRPAPAQAWRGGGPSCRATGATRSRRAASLNRAINAPFTVVHAAGSASVRINQQVAGAADVRGTQWLSLGTFTLRAALSPLSSFPMTRTASSSRTPSAWSPLPMRRRPQWRR